MDNNKVGWTHHTQNFWLGCNRVSPACRNCYIGQRRRGDLFHGPARTTEATWRKAFALDRKAVRLGVRPRVLSCSLSDFFHRGADPWREEAWDVIRECPNLDWFILTKRPQRIARCLPDDWGDGWDHVRLGVTVENRQCANRLDKLLSVPAKSRFISAEPLLGPLDLGAYLHKIDWIITGCERAAPDKRRSMDLDWVRDLRDQCVAAGVPLFFKQRYEGTSMCYDGVLDGVKIQEPPAGPSGRILKKAINACNVR